MARQGLGRRLVLFLLMISGLFAAATAAGAQPLGPVAGKAAQRMEAAAGGPLEIKASPLTGLAIFVAAREGSGIPVKALPTASAEERALGFLGAYGEAFGITDRAQVAVRRVSAVDEVGMEHVRLQQLHGGVPVTAGELMIHLRGAYVVAANGETLDDLESVGTTPTLAAEAAGEAVRGRLAKHLGITDAELSKPRLEVFNRGLLEDRRYPTRLAWFVEARRPDLWERFWIDAESGALLLQFSQMASAKNRLVYNGNSTATLPGTLIRVEGGPATGNTDADAAYDYSGDTYDYFLSQHGRDSYDGAGASLISTVDHCPTGEPCPWQNAQWNGTLMQMLYGDGFSAADDVDAHELTHAVTQYTADLFYYMQSGALNESFSDIFGETVDLTNGSGTDTSGVRWLMGEDVPGFGALRDMMDPTVFSDPGKASDAQFVCQGPGGDAGGVHSNSGVPNHAYALMVDGGSYNGFNITGIGLTKAGKVEYRALAQYLLSGSGFLDAYFAVAQACSDLVGTAGITSGDCSEVSKALDAVELWYYWRCSGAQQWRFDPCLTFPPDSVAFFDDLESGGANWKVLNGAGSTTEWYLGNFFATSGTQHLWGKELPTVNDSAVYMNSAVVLPINAYLYFRHSFGFENGASFYDGGVIEYSTNGGGAWTDAGGLIDYGASYGGVLSNGFSNPLGGRNAFVADSYGYTATRLNLSSLAGQSFRVRFRLGSDNVGNDYGWFIDDVGIYQCTGAIFSDGFESGDVTKWSSAVP